jgi:anti-sigma factor RsiW
VGIVLIAAFLGVGRWETALRQRTLGELADLHVATLASSAPVDVVSSDRHTVKPWFAGRIPFSFNLPDLSESPFSLLGGRVAYLHQEAGAQLLFQIRQHRISVFIFPGREGAARWFGMERTPTRQEAFSVETWTADGLRYFAISDVGAQDLHRLAELMRRAAQ